MPSGCHFNITLELKATHHFLRHTEKLYPPFVVTYALPSASY